MAALTALLPSVLANNQATNGNYSATDSKSTVETKNLMSDTPTSFIEFNGSDQYMVIPHHADFNVTTSESFTVSCWVKRNAMDPETRFVVKRVKNNATVKSGYELWGNALNNNFFAVNSPNNTGDHNNSVSVYSSIPGYVDEWHHVAFVIDRTAGVMYEYHNGTQVASSGNKNIAPWECSNTYDVLVGAGLSEENTPNYFLNGSIAGLHFYKRALSAEEIAADATAQVGTETEGLVAAYDFQNITGLKVTDISGNGHTGTLVGFTTDLPEIASVTLTQNSKFTGCGNLHDQILKATVVMGGTDATQVLRSVKMNLNGTTNLNDIAKIKFYKTSQNTFDERTAKDAVLLGEFVPAEGEMTCEFADATIQSGTCYLWLCAEVSETAAEGAKIDAELHEITTESQTFEIEKPAPTGSREILLKRRLVFTPGDYNSTNWRIPGLLQLSDGTLLTTTDKRKYNETDLPEDIDIVSRYSTDGGFTWSEPVTIAEGKGRKKGYGDAVIVEAANGDVVCGFVGGNGLWDSSESDPQWSYITISHDKGRTWGEPKNITDLLWGSKCDNTERKAFAHSFFGSGNGLRLIRGEHAGRILFVAAMGSGNQLHNYAVYSDDNGATWSVSERAFTNGDEAKVVELNDGRVLMSIRQSGYRGYSISADGGETWSAQSSWNEINTNACNGDIIRYTATDKGFNKDRLLHSIPNASSRQNVSIFISYDEGETWPVVKSICPYNSVYSSLTILPDGTIGAYVEENPEGACSLYFMNFSLKWLTDGQDIYTPAGEVLERVETPVFDPADGRLEEGETVKVTITCATPGATIHYTLDGTAPTEQSEVYTNAISVSSSVTIKAIAVKEGMLNSKAATAEFVYPAYCTPDLKTNHARYLTSVSVTDDDTNSFTSSQIQTSATPRAVYVDKTDEIIKTKAGATLNVSTVWGFEWMHAYVYIDYNKDKEFDVTLNADGNNKGELVSYTFYAEDGGDYGTNSLGERKKNNVGANGALPRFIIPQDLAAGDYRIRFKIDWNDINPCGSVAAGNGIANNGGTIADFTLRIESSGGVGIKDVNDAPETVFTGVAGGIAIEGQDCVAEVFDGQGRLIVKKAVTNGSFISLPAGFYIIRNGKVNMKVIVKA